MLCIIRLRLILQHLAEDRFKVDKDDDWRICGGNWFRFP